MRSHLNKDEKQIVTPIQRPSPARNVNIPLRKAHLRCFDSILFKTNPSLSLNIFDDDDDEDDGTLRLHVSNIPFTWSKEKLAEVFGVCIDSRFLMFDY